MEMVLLLLVVVVAYSIPPYMASQRNRNVAGWLLIGILINPIIAVVLLLVLPEIED